MPWEYRPALDAGCRAAIGAGKNALFVCPPEPWAVLPLLETIDASGPDGGGDGGGGEGLATVMLIPERGLAIEMATMLATAGHLGPAHAATGLARTARLLGSGGVRTLIATPSDAHALVRRAQLKLGGVRRIVVLWPGLFAAGAERDAVEHLLAEARGVGRIVVTPDVDADADFVQHHAHRAPLTVGARLPEAPVARVRLAVVPRAAVDQAVRDTLDSLNPASSLVWDPSPGRATRWSWLASDPTVRVVADPAGPRVALAIATAVPSREALAALAAQADTVAVLARASAVGYLRALAAPVEYLRLPTEADRAGDRARQLRETVRERLAEAAPDGGLLALAPLFDEFDPALVAAALAGGPGAGKPPPDAGGTPGLTGVPQWVAVRVDAGDRDRLRTGDIVGALLNAVGIPKDHIGRVDVRNAFTLVYVQAAAADRARRGLDGAVLRGRRVSARFDRG